MKVSPAKKQAFCEALVLGQTPEGAAKAIGASRRTVYRWRAADPTFAVQWADASDRKIEVVENVLYRMAVEKDLGAVIFFLKSHKPEVYNRRQIIGLGGDLDNPLVVHRGGDPAEVVHVYIPTNGRDRPEAIDADAQPVVTIEGERADDAA